MTVRLYEAARRLFGSWEEAVERAGFDYEQVTGIRWWTREKVVARIQEFAKKGIPLEYTSMQKNFAFLVRAATREFPTSWTKALRAAGLNPADHRTPRGNWTEDTAKEWVRMRLKKRKPILARDAPKDLVSYVQRRLHTPWADFIESLGVPYPGIKKRRDWTKAKLLIEIRKWKREGNPLNYRAVKDHYQALIHQARKFFGSWDRARAKAGV